MPFFFPKKIEMFVAAFLISKVVMDTPLWELKDYICITVSYGMKKEIPTVLLVGSLSIIILLDLMGYGVHPSLLLRSCSLV